jgi:hypothetical protein
MIYCKAKEEGIFKWKKIYKVSEIWVKVIGKYCCTKMFLDNKINHNYLQCLKWKFHLKLIIHIKIVKIVWASLKDWISLAMEMIWTLKGWVCKQVSKFKWWLLILEKSNYKMQSDE